MENCAPQEGLHQLRHQRRADDPRAQAEHIHIIVFDALVGGVDIVAQAGIDTFDLVGRDTGPNPRAADQNPALGLPFQNRPANLFGIIRIIDRFRAERAQVTGSCPASRTTRITSSLSGNPAWSCNSYTHTILYHWFQSEIGDLTFVGDDIYTF